MLQKQAGSDNPSDVTVRLAHRNGTEKQQAKAFTKGLRRRDLTSAFVARFHTKYQKADGCWPWTAGRFPRGYGMVNLGRDMRGRQFTTYAHRVSFVLAKGPIEPGQVVMHTCDVPACVNPDHLALGTQGDNIRDCFAKGRQAKTRNRRKAA
jgi:hypothetical protein